MPADRRLRYYLTAPIRAGRARLSGILLHFSRVVAQGSLHRTRSPYPPSPYSHSQTSRAFDAPTSSSNIPPAQPYPSDLTPSLSTEDQALQPGHTLLEREDVPQSVAQASTSHVDTPPYPVSSAPYLSNYEHSTATPQPVPNASALHTPTPSPPPSASPAFTNPHDSPPPSPPAYVATQTPTLNPSADYGMTPQGGPSTLPSPPTGTRAHSTVFQAPSSVAWTPQQNAHALGAFAPSPSLAHRQLRAVTPEVISPRTALGDLGIEVFYDPNDLGATRTPRATPRASPYMRDSPPRRSVRRVVPLPLISGENAGASGSRLAPPPAREVEDERMDVDEPASTATTTRVPDDLPDLSGPNSSNSPHQPQGSNSTPVASGSTPSATAEDTNEDIRVDTPTSPTTPPAAPVRTIVNLPGTPVDPGSVLPVDTPGLETRQEHGAYHFAQNGADNVSAHEAEIRTESEHISDDEEEVSTHEADVHRANAIRDAYIDTLDALHTVANRLGAPQPQDNAGEQIVYAVNEIVLELQRDLSNAHNIARTVQRQLEGLQRMGGDITSVKQVIDQAVTTLRRFTAKTDTDINATPGVASTSVN